ncbi:bifunctional acyl-CoA synthetase/GNAT family N-acetyltransferase [Halioglobus maricola]|uniref:Bifunctional acyl-CoA synthetase/GNAT family N-acetyltransferase n=1 Tax=Halioglobus maricola TaxID=2601894 RepID=A0A5P9NM87_9GAMM|nr:bifunctional acetate--CoA ligase family protein/GNAT family N-acetyltransferase [Halioglobus maricola]QFU76887.1 bifunctional acyl-CoA synthetase/GNAT family N-acetyltransferase [Halioglobus maricola]
MRKHYLESIFSPESVAVICDQEYSPIGEQVLNNLDASGFKGDIHLIAAAGSKLAQRTARAAIADVDGAVELVIVAARADRQAAIMRECGDAQVKAVVILSGGFSETQEAGLALQNELVEIARRHNIAVVGPRCLGIIRPRNNLNASSARSPVKEGKVALVTQSGAFCSAILDWADEAGYGFSAVASLGATSDVKLGDVLDYLAQDPSTSSILLYVERITNARLFLSGLRAAARLKPVVVIKSGRNESGARAALNQMQTPLGSDEVFDAAILRAGAVRVTIVNQLIAAATILSSGARVSGSRLGVITNGGAPGVMAADWAGSIGVPLAELAPETLDRLSEILPDYWSHSHPVDILGNADAERYRAATEALLADAGVDGVLVLLTPQGFTDASACAEGVIAASEKAHKPVLASWMGAGLVAEGRERMASAGIPQFVSPEAGVDAFNYLARYRRNQSALMQVPEPLSEHRDPDSYGAKAIIDQVLAERRTTLSIAESRAVLSAFRIPVLPSSIANSAAEALVAAENLGLPVAMKIVSPDIEHKSEVGGVRLNVSESRSVHTAYEELMRDVARRDGEARLQGVSIEPMVDRPHARELLIGITYDPVFGPVVHLGPAGTAAEAISGETQVALPPLNDFLARELVDRTAASRYLRQFRKLPEVNMAKLSEVLQRVSEIACELPSIAELEINPLLVDEEGVVAVDARITVRQQDTGASRYGHMAIHPYPADLESQLLLADGSEVLLRPIRPEDGHSEDSFVANLSAESRYFRFMHGLHRLTPSMLARFTQIDYDREMALVAIEQDEEGRDTFIGVARYVTNPDANSCEFALTVADEWQSRGVGPRMMERLIYIARRRGLETMIGEVLAQNSRMLRMCKRLGFRSLRSPEDPEIVVVTLPL